MSNGIGTVERAPALVSDHVPAAWSLSGAICGDCGGTGGILDPDGSLTGEVGRPTACGCMGFMPVTAEVSPGCEDHRARIDLGSTVASGPWGVER